MICNSITPIKTTLTVAKMVEHWTHWTERCYRHLNGPPQCSHQEPEDHRGRNCRHKSTIKNQDLILCSTEKKNK